MISQDVTKIWYPNTIRIVGPNSSNHIQHSDFHNSKNYLVLGIRVFGIPNSIKAFEQLEQCLSEEFHIFSIKNVLYRTNIFILVYFPQNFVYYFFSIFYLIQNSIWYSDFLNTEQYSIFGICLMSENQIIFGIIIWSKKGICTLWDMLQMVGGEHYLKKLQVTCDMLHRTHYL